MVPFCTVQDVIRVLPNGRRHLVTLCLKGLGRSLPRWTSARDVLDIVALCVAGSQRFFLAGSSALEYFVERGFATDPTVTPANGRSRKTFLQTLKRKGPVFSGAFFRPSPPPSRTARRPVRT